eukprot:m.4177 g.4177  ORF g.4177 m.4177 type:complete len:112 (+) comp10350_c0_seq1:35-370(+)
MDCYSGAKPRINKSLMRRYRGKDCVLVGRVKSVAGPSSITIETSDKETVTVECGFGTFSSMEGVVELIVSVGFDERLVAKAATCYGEDFDLNVYDEAVQVATKYSLLFGVE